MKSDSETRKLATSRNLGGLCGPSEPRSHTSEFLGLDEIGRERSERRLSANSARVSPIGSHFGLARHRFTRHAIAGRRCALRILFEGFHAVSNEIAFVFGV